MTGKVVEIHGWMNAKRFMACGWILHCWCCMRGRAVDMNMHFESKQKHVQITKKKKKEKTPAFLFDWPQQRLIQVDHLPLSWMRTVVSCLSLLYSTIQTWQNDTKKKARTKNNTTRLEYSAAHTVYAGRTAGADTARVHVQVQYLYPPARITTSQLHLYIHVYELVPYL